MRGGAQGAIWIRWALAASWSRVAQDSSARPTAAAASACPGGKYPAFNSRCEDRKKGGRSPSPPPHSDRNVRSCSLSTPGTTGVCHPAPKSSTNS